jgi:hypothetical protein
MSFSNLEVLKGQPTKSIMNNASSVTLKIYIFGIKKLKNKQKLQLIRTYENMVQLNYSKVPNY